MSGTETRLRELLEASVGEPPHSVSLPTVRRLDRWRRTVHGIAALSSATALCAVVSVLALGLAAPLSGHTPASSPRAGGVPSYYIQEHDYDLKIFGGFELALVRDTASGAVKATVRCPSTGAAITGIASAGDEKFYLACERASGKSIAWSRLYRFRLTSAGRVSGYTPVPGGVLQGVDASDLTAAAGGPEIAMVTSVGHAGYPVGDGVLVINTRTGAHAVWRGAVASDDLPTLNTSLPTFTLSPNGRDLMFLEVAPVSKEAAVFEEREVSPADRGGQLSSARVLVHWPGASVLSVVSYAQLSPGGSVLTVAGDTFMPVPLKSSKATCFVEQISVPSGKVIRVLFRASRRRSGLPFLSATSDPTGRYIILYYGTGDMKTDFDYFNGWLDHGRLVPLAPAHGIPYNFQPASPSSLGPETW